MQASADRIAMVVATNVSLNAKLEEGMKIVVRAAVPIEDEALANTKALFEYYERQRGARGGGRAAVRAGALEDAVGRARVPAEGPALEHAWRTAGGGDGAAAGSY